MLVQRLKKITQYVHKLSTMSEIFLLTSGWLQGLKRAVRMNHTVILWAENPEHVAKGGFKPLLSCIAVI